VDHPPLSAAAGPSGEPALALRTSYFVRIPNIGDRVTPAVVAAVAGRPATHYAAGSEPHLVAIGSVMANTTPQSHVWGTGVMHPDMGLGAVTAAHVHALRGQLSLDALRRGGVDVGEIPLGDPGYLAPALLGIQRAAAPSFRVGLVCHYVDRWHPVMRRLMHMDGVIDLDVHAAPDEFLRRMAQCDTVVSSSLHGLVFAEALGIPNLWVEAGREVAGDGFKFRDWYTTTRRPQKAPHAIAEGDTVEALADRAECRESTIDTAALAEAFPRRYLDALSRPARRLPVDACRRQPLPVFLISFNRGDMLRQSVNGLRRLATPVDIVVHDNGSTAQSTLLELEALQREGITVVRAAPIDSPDDLNRVDDTVQGYFADWEEPARYAVSDCDVDLSSADDDVLEVYDELLNTWRRAECIGPMLRIRDIPADYPLFNRVMNRHIEQFWRHAPTFTETSRGAVAVLPAVVDTTFALHRAGEGFRRLKMGLRVYEPFEARHLDWYLGGEPSAEARGYARSSSPAVSHWNNDVENERHRDVPLDYQTYLVVRRTSGGTLEVREEHVSPQSSAAPVS